MPSDRGVQTIRIALQSEPIAVRQALKGLFGDRLLHILQGDQRDTAELILAEVLNNVVEHAYAGGTGEIEVSVSLRDGSLVFTIVDGGAEMPGRTLPDGVLGDPSRAASLPEGGFGWHMVRTLARDVGYRRTKDRNVLSFSLDLT